MRQRDAVALEPFVGHLRDLGERLEDPRIEDFVALRIVEAFNESVLIRLSFSDVLEVHAIGSCRRTSACSTNSRLLAHHGFAGSSCIATSCFSTCTTRTLGSDIPISIVSASRSPSSKIFGVR